MTGQRPPATLPVMDGSQNRNGPDPDLWHPADKRLEDTRTYLCYGRPYRASCLDHALDHDVRGVWGGTSHAQRQAIREQRNIAA